VPVAPAADYNIGTVDSAAYSSFEVDMKKQVKDQLIGDNTQLQVWAGKTWGAYGNLEQPIS
jgi:hypothetical protein